MARLLVYNPSDYPRAGHVCTPWQPIREATGIDAARLRILDDQGRPLPAQVDPVDLLDPSRDVLTFLLHDALPPGADDQHRAPSAVFLLTEGRPDELGDGPRAQIERDMCRLVNDRLDLWMSLHGMEGRPWYAGAAVSVVLRADPAGLRPWTGGAGVDVLDAFTSLFGWEAHDPEKRCMQVDRLRLGGPFPVEVPVFATPHSVICSSSGPVRAAVTLQTQPFAYRDVDPVSGERREGEWRLRRVLSLFRDADYVLEEMYLVPARLPVGGEESPPPAAVEFSASWFAAMDMGILPEIGQYAPLPNWLAIGCPMLPYQGYGFATDVHASHVMNPHPGYPFPERAHRTFSWELGFAGHVRCLHLFRFAPPEALAEETGRAWYNHVYKPLRASVASEGSVP